MQAFPSSRRPHEAGEDATNQGRQEMNFKLRSFLRLPAVALALTATAVLGACSSDGDDGDGCDDGLVFVNGACQVPAGAGELTGTISTSRTLAAETTYVLKGFVKVASGATLTIPAGTRIVGDTLTPGSSLFVLRGARLVVNGTAQAPVVFTSQRTAGNRKPGDWGGIVIVGNGIVNRAGNISTEGPAEAAQNYGGGTNNADDSGNIRYMRVEFAGFDVSGGQGQELNSLSMYAVGRGTRIEYVQSVAGLDDSFEWWGGAVDTRYLLSTESGDDHFDWTEGHQGRHQFLIAFQNTRLDPRQGSGVFGSDPRGFEGDGCDPATAGCTVNADTTNTPFSNPVFSNFTLIGFPAVPVTDGNGMVLRRGTAGTFYNGVVARWKGTALNIRDSFTNKNRTVGRLDVRSLVFAENGANYDSEAGSNFGKASFFTTAGNREVAGGAAALFVGLTTGGPDFTPAAGSVLATGGSNVPAERVAGYNYGWTNTAWVGAVDPSGANKWWQGWAAFVTN